MIRRVGRRGGPLEWNRVHQKVFTGDRKKKRVGWVGVREREREERPGTGDEPLIGPSMALIVRNRRRRRRNRPAPRRLDDDWMIIR